MAQRVVVRIDLNERRKLSPADIFDTITAFLKRAARRQMSNVRRQAWYLVKLGSLLM